MSKKFSTAEKRAIRRTDNFRRRTSELLKAGNAKSAQHVSKQYLSSKYARHCAALNARDALEKSGRDVPSRKELPNIIEQLSAWDGTDEPAYVSFKEKADGNFRPVVSFGLKNRTLQELVVWILRTLGNINKNQFACQGGANQIIEEVLKAYTEGKRHIGLIDISSCYSSFDEGKLLGALPLPKEVVEKVIISKHLTLRPYKSNPFMLDTDVWTAPGKLEKYPSYLASDFGAVLRGIPQGSSASPLVCEILLSDLWDFLPHVGKVLNYADNFILMAESKQELMSLGKALRCGLKSHPAGPLELSMDDYIEPNCSFEFVGYELSPKHGHLTFRPSKSNLSRFHQRLQNQIARLRSETKSGTLQLKEKKRLIRMINGWYAGFPKWMDGEKRRLNSLSKVDKIDWSNSV